MSSANLPSSPVSAPVIDVRHADVYIEGHQILHQVDWQVQRGEHWFLLGANGCGKSTLMHLVMAYQWPALGGSVSVLGYTFGECVTQDIRKRIGWVGAYLQGWTRGNAQVLNVVLSGFDASIGLYREPTAEETAKAHARLAASGADGLAERTFGSLSSGQQLRVLIARATVHDPALLILDEPCCHLDLRAREDFLTLVRELAAGPSAPTLVLVTHRVDDLIDTFTHGLIMKEGRIIARGPRDAVLTRENLRAAFGLNIGLQRIDGRYWMHLESDASRA